MSAILFIEGMITFLLVNTNKSDAVKKLKQYIEDEEFDTDSIKMDVDQDSDGQIRGNIADQITNETVMTSLNSFIQTNASYDHSLIREHP